MTRHARGYSVSSKFNAHEPDLNSLLTGEDDPRKKEISEMGPLRTMHAD